MDFSAWNGKTRSGGSRGVVSVDQGRIHRFVLPSELEAVFVRRQIKEKGRRGVLMPHADSAFQRVFPTYGL